MSGRKATGRGRPVAKPAVATAAERRRRLVLRLRAMCQREARALASGSRALGSSEMLNRAARLRALEQALGRVAMESRSRRAWIRQPTSLILIATAMLTLAALWGLWQRRNPVEARLSLQCLQFSCRIAPQSSGGTTVYPLQDIDSVAYLAIEGQLKLSNDAGDDAAESLPPALASGVDSLGRLRRVSMVRPQASAGVESGSLDLAVFECPAHLEMKLGVRTIFTVAEEEILTMALARPADVEAGVVKVVVGVPAGWTVRLDGDGGSWDWKPREYERVAFSATLEPTVPFSLQCTPSARDDAEDVGVPVMIGLEGFQASRLGFWMMDQKLRQELPGGDSAVVTGVVSIPGTELPDRSLHYRQPIFSSQDGVRESPLQATGTLNWVRLVRLGDESPLPGRLALELDWQGKITNGKIGYAPDTVDISPQLLFWFFGDSRTLYMSGLAVYGFVIVSALLRRSVPGATDFTQPSDALL